MKLYRVMKKPPAPLSVSTWITDEDHAIQAGPGSRRAVMIPLLLMQYGSMMDKLRVFAHLRQDVSKAIADMHRAARSIRDNPPDGRRTIDSQTLGALEAYARELGASSIGYTKLDPDHIFTHFEVLYDNAIVLTIEMDQEAIATSPSLECNREIMRTYRVLGEVVLELADWLRERGYACHPSPALGGDINTVPTAQAANLGYIGKNGILVTPEHGPCVRLAAIFLEAEGLPFAGDNGHGWIEAFCDTCDRCVEACPGGAIYRERHEVDGVRTWIEREKCAPHFSKGCSVCIASCVFTGGHYDRLKGVWDRRHPDQAQA